MTKIKGSCLCGNVQYSSAAEPRAQVVCHCLDCQKQTGTAFSIVVGEDTSWIKPTVNVYCETAQPWVTMGEGMENHDRMMPF